MNVIATSAMAPVGGTRHAAPLHDGVAPPAGTEVDGAGRGVVIRIGDCRDVLRAMAAESVHCVVTSPPYWGLRDYRIPPSVWGGDPDCNHRWGAAIVVERATNHADKRRWQHSRNGRDEEQPTHKRVGWLRTDVPQGQFCDLCGAWAGAHGLEPTLQLYIENEVAIFRELHRVLRSDGTLWLNLGDCYAADGKFGGETGGKQAYLDDDNRKRTGREKRRSGLKPKDRCMLPARVALALQDDGWWLRDEIVWHKPNPMPSSVTDRTTPAHEMLYLLSKRAHYYYDAEAIKEAFSAASIARLTQASIVDQQGGDKADQYDLMGLNARSGSRRPNEIVAGLAQKIVRKPAGWDTADGAHSTLRHTAPAVASSGNKERKFGVDPDSSVPWEGTTRNKRSVWTIASEPFPDAHFATFPTALVEPIIKAGTSEKGCCAACGAPWRRIVKRRFRRQADVSAAKETTGWRPSCQCDAGIVPALVLDPFGGSGTVGLVADRLGRRAVLIDRSEAYAQMARTRLVADAGLFAAAALERSEP
jgi:DNA modification methylase